MAGLGPGRRVAGHVGVPEHPGHFLNDIVDPVRRRAHVGPVGRHQTVSNRSSARADRRRASTVKPDRLEERGDLVAPSATPIWRCTRAMGT
jgi:hypothetical protein